MEELISNIKEFFESANDNLAKNRYNAAISDFFKAIVIMCDYLIYENFKILPKNHNERFSLLKKYYYQIYVEISRLFKIYTKSYNLRMNEEDANEIKKYAYKLKEIAKIE